MGPNSGEKIGARLIVTGVDALPGVESDVTLPEQLPAPVHPTRACMADAPAAQLKRNVAGKTSLCARTTRVQPQHLIPQHLIH